MDNPKRKLLILIEWFAPGYKAGGPIQSCVNLCIALRDQLDIFVFTTDTDHGEANAYEDIVADEWQKADNIGVDIFYAKKKELSFGKLAKIIREVNADFIYLNLFFSPVFVLYPLWLKLTHKIKARVILCPRGTLYDSALAFKAYQKRPMLALIKWVGLHKQIRFHATSEREKDAVLHYFPGSVVVIAENLPNMAQPAFTSCSKQAGSLKCIFIARVVPIKNLLFLLRCLKQLEQQVSLTVIGPVEDENYWHDCKNEIAALPLNIGVFYEGPKKNKELLAILQQHHLFVLPTTGENFGHAIFESLLAGRPVLISDQTPWQDLEEKKAGWSKPLTDAPAFTDILTQMALLTQGEFDAMAMSAWRYADEFLKRPGFIEQYKELFRL